MTRGAVLIGTSGWTYGDWRGPVYHHAPQSRWLAAYAERFPTVEVNATFYRLPTPRMVQRWVDQTPENFCFSVKVSRYLTHVRRLQDVEDGMARLMELLEPMTEAGKRGPMLWQLPPSFRRDDSRLGHALEHLPAGRHAFEFRDPSWFCQPVFRLLHDAGAALVVGDVPGRPYQTFNATAGWRYLRFHRGARGRRGNYSDRELDVWAARVRRWCRSGDVYAYFNNDWEAFAVRNAMGLERRLGAEARRA